MRLFMLLSVYYLATLGSDLARVYPPGQEKALGNQTGGLPAVNGKELASVVNSGLAHQQANGSELTK